MTITFVELKEKLKELDEISLLELLEIDSEMLVECFSDIIDDRYDTLIEKVD